jgi:hypothetical protein
MAEAMVIMVALICVIRGTWLMAMAAVTGMAMGVSTVEVVDMKGASVAAAAVGIVAVRAATEIREASGTDRVVATIRMATITTTRAITRMDTIIMIRTAVIATRAVANGMVVDVADPAGSNC